MIHRGEIVEKAIRKGGYSLTKLAQQLAISRNTLYNRFNNPNLDAHFIGQIGKIIHYDFTILFPDMKKEAGLLEKDQPLTLEKIESKYAQLLEKQANLLELLTRIASENDLPILQEEITQIIEEERQRVFKDEEVTKI